MKPRDPPRPDGAPLPLHGFRFSRAGVLLQRPFELARAFGFSSRKYARTLDRYRELLEKHDVSATFPVTAVTLRRHSGVVRRLADSGHELAVHGLTHVDHSRLDLAVQTKRMTRARRIFRALGLEPEGFRCPYLWWNAHTRAAAARAGFSYVSNQVRIRGEYDSARVRRLYHVDGTATVSSLPSFRDGIVEIPVSLPDDFLLAERLSLPPEAIADVWLAMLQEAVDAGEMFVLQLHPELLPRCGLALDRVLSAAGGDSRVWVTTMAEVARWWRRRPDPDALAGVWPPGKRAALCVTGDIDCVTLRDYAWRLVGQ